MPDRISAFIVIAALAASASAREIPAPAEGDLRVLGSLVKLTSSADPGLRAGSVSGLDDPSGKLPPSANYLFFELAKVYAGEGNYGKALEALEKIDPGYFKSEPLKYEALRLKASAYGRTGQPGREALLLGELSSMTGISPARSREAAFFEADAWARAGAPERAKRILRELAFDTTANPFGSRAFRRFAEMAPGELEAMEPAEKYALIERLCNCGRASDGYFLLNTIAPEKRDVGATASVLYKLRSNSELFALADGVVSSVEKKPGAGGLTVVLKALWATLRTADGARSSAYFDYLKAQAAKGGKLLREAFYARGSFLYCEGRFADSLALLAEASADEKLQFYRNCRFKMGLCSFYAGQKDPSYFSSLLEPDNGFSQRSAYALENLMGTRAATSLRDDSYYRASGDREFSGKVAAAAAAWEGSIFKGRSGPGSFVHELAKAGFPLYALNELERGVPGLSPEEKLTRLALLSECGLYCREFKDFTGGSIGLAFPTPFRGAIERAALSEGVDEALMFAIARRESRFDPFAYSVTGAVGLFQLMPATASRVVGRPVSEEELLDPRFNAAVAAKYLRTLGGSLPGDAMVVASYNAGEDVVGWWKKSFPGEDPLFSLMIPYYETQNYTEGVLFDKMVYQALLSRP